MAPTPNKGQHGVALGGGCGPTDPRPLVEVLVDGDHDVAYVIVGPMPTRDADTAVRIGLGALTLLGDDLDQREADREGRLARPGAPDRLAAGERSSGRADPIAALWGDLSAANGRSGD